MCGIGRIGKKSIVSVSAKDYSVWGCRYHNHPSECKQQQLSYSGGQDRYHHLHHYFHLADRLIINIHVLGNSLNCSRLMEMAMPNIYRCGNRECTTSVCIAGGLFVAGTSTWCCYRCHCKEGCHAIVIDVSQFAPRTDHREMCEIVILAPITEIRSLGISGFR